MRSVLSLIVWLAVILITSAARGQGASAIEPYEVLYGRPLVIQLRLPTQKMLPSEATLALVQARTDTLLARVASVSAALTPGGEIGVRGALGDWIEVIGKVAGGFEGSTKIDLSPFKWTFKIDLGEGKGTFTVKSKLGLSYEKKATIWDKRPILAERTIIG